MKNIFLKYYLESSAFLLGVALSGLSLSVYYTVNDKKEDSNSNLICSGISITLALIIGSTGKFLEERK